MTWYRADETTLACPPWLIRRGGWLGGTVYRLFRDGKLVAVCPSAEKARQVAESGHGE